MEHNEKLIDAYLPADYSDSFSQEVRVVMPVTPEEFLDMAFNRLSPATAALLRLRNILVKPLGLKTDGRFTDWVRDRNQNEIVCGLPDSHLTFHVSLWCSDVHEGRQTLELLTVVQYNNTLGRIYFFFVRPFHRVIIRSMMKRVGRTCSTNARGR